MTSGDLRACCSSFSTGGPTGGAWEGTPYVASVTGAQVGGHHRGVWCNLES